MYNPQADVAVMMKLFGQDVKVVPSMIEDDKDRLLAANLIAEEAMETVEALGFKPEVVNGVLHLVPNGKEPDLVKAADGIGDTLVVVYGAANRMGLNAQALFHEVNRSNMTKVWPDGTVHRRESDGKVIKPTSYSPANIKDLLESMTASSLQTYASSVYPEVAQAVAKGMDMWSFIATEAFGKLYGFTYNIVEKSRDAGPTGHFARPALARVAAKLIVFMNGHKFYVTKFAQLLQTTEATAEELIEAFRVRFPNLLPTITAPVQVQLPITAPTVEPPVVRTPIAVAKTPAKPKKQTKEEESYAELRKAALADENNQTKAA